jgi:hypothetical protein
MGEKKSDGKWHHLCLYIFLKGILETDQEVSLANGIETSYQCEWESNHRQPGAMC